MGQHTHHLPKHLGNWPCRVLETAANNGLGQMLQLVEYSPDNDTTLRIYVHAAELTPIRPDEPSTQYALDDRCDIWQHVPEQPDYGPEISLWRPVHSGPALDWPTLWDRHGPIRPLAEIPHVTVPWEHGNDLLGRRNMSVRWLANPVTIRASLGSGTVDLDPDVAELFAAALLDAARKARAHIAKTGGWVQGEPGLGGFAEPKFGEHTAETDRPLASGGIAKGDRLISLPYVTLPWTSPEDTGIRVEKHDGAAYPDGSGIPVKVTMGSDWALILPAEAYEFAAALIAATEDITVYPAGTFVKGPAWDRGVLRDEADRVTGGIVKGLTRIGEGDQP